MQPKLDIDEIYELADMIASDILETSSAVDLLSNIENPNWNEIPKPSSRDLVFGSVDGGNRAAQGRGVYLIYSQAAGRCMGTGNTQTPKDLPWTIKRYGVKISTGGPFVSDLSSRIRERLELSVATDLVEKYAPDYLLLDGTLVGLFIVGIPTRVIVSRNEDPETLNDDLTLFKKELIAYGHVIQEFFDAIDKYGTRVIGLSKDSYSKIFVPEELLQIGINDPVYFSIISKGKPGYSHILTDSGYSRLSQLKIEETGKPFLLEMWAQDGITISRDNTNVNIFFANLIRNGEPVRIDYFSNITASPKEILADLLNVSDGKDWFIPPRLAHERAKVKSDLFNGFLKQVYKRIAKNNPDLANIMLGSTRRQRTQGG